MTFTVKKTTLALAAIALVGLLFFNQNNKEKAPKINKLNLTKVLPTNKRLAASSNIKAQVQTPEPSQKKTSPPTSAKPSKAMLVREILASKNDNDPRLDRELKYLNSEERSELKVMYKNLREEDRNGRGTLVFLLGRNIETQSDIDFFSQVLEEPPCLSMQDCNQDFEAEHSHGSPLGASLFYPQVIALKSLEKKLNSGSAQS